MPVARLVRPDSSGEALLPVGTARNQLDTIMQPRPRIQITQPAASGVRSFVDEHPRPDGQGPRAGAGRELGPGQERPADGKAYWTIESEEPLTLTPSLLCTACHDHGWVRDGMWAPA
jgi:hypothetical protein